MAHDPEIVWLCEALGVIWIPRVSPARTVMLCVRSWQPLAAAPMVQVMVVAASL